MRMCLCDTHANLEKPATNSLNVARRAAPTRRDVRACHTHALLPQSLGAGGSCVAALA